MFKESKLNFNRIMKKKIEILVFSIVMITLFSSYIQIKKYYYNFQDEVLPYLLCVGDPISPLSVNNKFTQKLNTFKPYPIKIVQESNDNSGFKKLDGQIILGTDATKIEQYAAKELQRYLYDLSGEFIPIYTDKKLIDRSSFVIGQINTNKKINDFVKNGNFIVGNTNPGEQGYVLKKFRTNNHDVIAIAGSDSTGTLYGVYGLLDDYYKIGFYTDGDVIPQHKIALTMVTVDEKKLPAQSIRGILPWVNFPQSATVYSLEDYKFVIDQMAKMRLNLLNIHNYNGQNKHQETNFPWNPNVRYWMATTKSGHNWDNPGWFVDEYRFGSKDLYDDYDFGSEVTLHNESLSNAQIISKSTAFFQQIINYAHKRGVKIALGVELTGDKREQEFIIKNYSNLDYVLMYEGEWGGAKGFNTGFYEALKKNTKIKMGLSGWGLKGDLSGLPADLIAAPIAPYSAGFVSGAQYLNREYWGCPWMERDGDRNLLKKTASSEHWYPYNINLSTTISGYKNSTKNMTGFQTLTWRISDAISPKLSWVAKAPWSIPPGNTAGYTGGTLILSNNLTSSSSNINKEVFKSYHTGNFNYKFDVLESYTLGIYKYSVKLYFSEPKSNSVNARLFNVLINDEPKITNYDIYKAAGDKNKGIEVIIKGIECPFGILSINFESVKGDALLNAVVVQRDDGKWMQGFNCGAANVDSLKADQVYGANSYNAYYDFAVSCYGKEAAEDITNIINQNEPFAIGGGEAEKTPPLGDNSDPASSIAKANKQISIINFWISKTNDTGIKERLRLLRTRIWSTKCYNEITPSDKSDTKVWDFSNSFRDRVTDISSLGNLASFQSRYVKAYFTENNNPVKLKVTDLDIIAPRVLIISPPVSGIIGQGIDIKARVIDNREYNLILANLYYRITGMKKWEKVTMERRTKAIFGYRIPKKVLTARGLEYYVEAFDGTNIGMFPVTAPSLPLTIIGEEFSRVNNYPQPPFNFTVSDGSKLSWEPSKENLFLYRVYRSTKPGFSISCANYLCFFKDDKTNFEDIENDYSNQKKTGTYYYKVTAVDKYGFESEPTKSLAVKYNNNIK